MGNQAKSRIIILRDRDSFPNLSYHKMLESNIEAVQYTDWTIFTQKEAIQEIQNIIVTYKQQPVKKKMQGVKGGDILNVALGMTEGQHAKKNKFAQVCPFLSSQHLDTMKDKLINHIKKYSISINIYLYVQDTDRIQLMHYEKPYIKLVSSNLEYIMNSFLSEDRNVQNQSKSNRMFQGLYRRMVVKVLDQAYREKKKDGGKQKDKDKEDKGKDGKDGEKNGKVAGKSKEDKNKKVKQDNINQLLKQKSKIKVQPKQICEQQKQRLRQDSKLFQQYKIQPQYFNSIENFQKSFISTTCEYVICQEKDLYFVIDCQKKCQQEYKIILRLDQEKKKEAGNGQGDKKDQIDNKEPIFILPTNEVNNKSDKKDKETQKQVWLRTSDLKEILQKISNFSEISHEEAPFLSKNIIICGNDPFYNNYIDNNEKQKAQIIDKLHERFVNQSKKAEQNQQNARNIHISFVNGQKLQQKLLPEIYKTIYSYVVVFSQDQFVETVKKFLKVKGCNQRVQLTNIPNTDSSKYNTMSQPQRQKKIKQKISYLIDKVPYLIKFEVGPIVSIHLYKPSQILFSFFNDKIGLKAEKINSQVEFVSNYTKPNFFKVIESGRLVCNIDDYIDEIQPLQKKIQSLGLKIIIFDQDRKKMDHLARNPQKYYIPEIQYIDFDKLRIQNFVLKSKASTVSIPFFRPSVLSEFELASKALSQYKSSYPLSLQSSVLSSNETILNMLGQNYLGLNTKYSLGLILFKNSELGMQKEIIKFEEQYMTSYIRLWYFGLGLVRKEQYRRQTVYRTELELLRSQICHLFYKCKSYDLLNVSEDDFKQFYIQRIEECTDLLDLQIACIYILSLPHGFNNVISDLLRNKTKSKLAVKMFVVYMVVLMTGFYGFGGQEEETIKIMAYINKDIKINEGIKNIKQGDVVYTNDFVFCVDTKKQHINMKKVQSHLIVFKFDSIRVLQKSKIKSYLNIQKSSFYRQGPEYIIPPFTKFQVSKITSHFNGIYEVELQDITNREKSLPYRILKENQLSEDLLFQIYDSEINQKKNTEVAINKKGEENIPLYKRTEKVNVLKNKIQVVEQFKKGKNYNMFYQDKNAQKYMSALVHLASQMKTVSKQQEKGGTNSQKRKQIQNLLEFGVETAYLYYHMNQYMKSISKLKELKQVMQEEDSVNERQIWKKNVVNRVCDNVESTFYKRINETVQYPRRKFWKVTFQTNKQAPKSHGKTNPIVFKLKRRQQHWQNSYNPELEMFPLSYKGSQYSKWKMQSQDQPQLTDPMIRKLLQQKDLIPETSPNQFGHHAIQEIQTKLFSYEKRGRGFKDYKEANQQIADESEQSGAEDQTSDQFDQFFPMKEGQIQKWRVFFIANQPKLVTTKKKHYQVRLGNCNHTHADLQKKKRYIIDEEKDKDAKIDKFRVKNTNDEGLRYFVPNDQVASQSGHDQFFVPNTDVIVQ